MRQVNMFIVLLLLSNVSCEWVEITQNIYRQDLSRIKQKSKIQNVTENFDYRGVVTSHRSKATINKITNADLVTKPYLIMSSTSHPMLDGIDVRMSEKTVRNPFEIKRVSNRHDLFEHNQFNSKSPYSSNFNNFKITKVSTITKNNGTNVKKESSLESFAYENATRPKNSQITQNKLKYKNASLAENDNVDREVEKRINKPRNESVDIEREKRRGIVTKIKKISSDVYRPQSVQNKYDEKANIDTDHLNVENIPANLSNFIKNDKTGIANNEEEQANGENNPDETNINNQITNNKIEGIVKTLKLVAETISKHTHKGFMGKMKYLENLKQSILASIEDHVDRVWPDDTPLRVSRSPHERGHVEIPSSESALMTISFLTFAVFLIKLVLQVIHTYKQKSMMVTPAVVAAVGRASTVFKLNHN